MTTKKRKQKETALQPAPTSSKRACLGNLPGDTILTKDLARKLKIPDFIATLEARQWKQEASLVRSYFQHTDIPESTSKHLMTVLNGALHRIMKTEDVDVKLKSYSTALLRQLETEKSKEKLNVEYKKLNNEHKIAELEEAAENEARVTSRLLTTVEARAHRQCTQRRLDEMFEEDESDQENSQASATPAATLDDSESEPENSHASTTHTTTGTVNLAAIIDNDPFVEEEEELPTLKVVKEKSLYKYQAPAKNIVSPHKPIIQATDLGVLKEYFDICISTNENEASEETKQEFMVYMKEQRMYKFLKEVPAGLYEKLLLILNIEDRLRLKKAIMELPMDSSFAEFAQYALIDYTLNLMKPGRFQGKQDERSIFCEVFIPLFKAFGNCLDTLNYTWCEKKAKDADYVWLVSNDFSKEKKDNLKLLDGVGTLAESTYLIMESSGFSNDNMTSHTLNDTLKNIKTAHDNLKYMICKYRKASFNTMKKVNIFSCQIIEDKVTLIKYSVKCRTTWKVVECRSASVPLDLQNSLNYMRVFELFAFLLADIKEQQLVLKQLKMENLGLVDVPVHETVAHCLL